MIEVEVTAVSIPLAIRMESKLGMGLGIQTLSQKIRYRSSNPHKISIPRVTAGNRYSRGSGVHQRGPASRI